MGRFQRISGKPFHPLYMDKVRFLEQFTEKIGGNKDGDPGKDIEPDIRDAYQYRG